jgi:Ca-activated chloride channel family protein
MKKTASLAILSFLTLAAAGLTQYQKSVPPQSSAEQSAPQGMEGPSTLPSDPTLPTESLDFTISRHVHEVNLILTVTDSKRRFVDSLTADDFRLLDNHKLPAKWSYFQARTNLPLHVILAIDVSSSIRDRLRFEQQAASHFLKNILRKETDEAAIVTFGSTVQEKTTGMTSDVNALDTAIRAVKAGGETAMYDAIVISSGKLHDSRKNLAVRPVIILITDGVDTASKVTLRAAEEAAIRSEAAIIALDSNSIYETNPKGRLVLEKLTQDTGGFVVPARENSDLKSAFGTVEKILRSQYALGYPPPNLEANGSFRPIEVTCTKRGLQVHTRNGYYAPAK